MNGDDDNGVKTHRTSSEVAKGIIKAAVSEEMALLGTRNNDPVSANYYKREMANSLHASHSRLTKHEKEGIGAGGEMMLNMPMDAGDRVGMELRDTVKNADMITATAQIDRLRLADIAGSLDLAIDAADTIEPRDSMEKMLAHQLSAAHVLAMRMAGNANHWLDRVLEYGNCMRSQGANVEAVRAAAASAKMMQAYQQGLLTLHRIRSGGQQNVTEVHQHVQVAGGNVAVAGSVNQGGGTKGG